MCTLYTVVGDNYNTIKDNFRFQFSSISLYQAFNSILVGWGGPGEPPPTDVFGHKSKRIGVRLYTFFYFSSYHTMPLTLGSKRGFCKYCPGPQAYCLNAVFNQTKSLFRPTSSQWILTFYRSLKRLEQ